MPDEVPALSLVEPKADSPLASPAEPNPAAPEAQEQPTPAETPQLPPELLKLPVMQALVAGAPPAVSANIKEFSSNPTAELVIKNANALKQAGMGFYRSLGGDIGVVFNQLKLHPEDLIAADKAGKLSMLAPPFDMVNHGISKSGLDNPVLQAGAKPTGAAPSPMLRPPPQLSAGLPGPSQGAPATPPMVKPASAGLQKQIMATRAKNVTPSAPTSGPAPGAGRLLNQILTPAV
jgi:hypothetical protein